MPTVDIDGVRIAYSDGGGAAPPVLLLPGVGGSRAMWDPITPYLAGYRVLILEPRGSGDSESAPGFYSATELARDAARVLEAAGVGDTSILGLSMGGMIAQALAASISDRVRCLALVCTYAAPDEWARRCFSLA